MDKITYATLGSLGEAFHKEFDLGLRQVRQKLGARHPLFINGQARKARAGTFADCSPADTRIVLGHFQTGGREETRQAIAAAKQAFPDWRAFGWQSRVAYMRKAAEVMRERQVRLAALLSLEIGKNRFEAMAEVAESIDLLLYYARQMELHHGYEYALGGVGAEHTRSVLKPYGVWAVVSPFNFPLALATGMACGALLGGNTVVFKPASDAPWAGLALYEIFHEAGLPIGVFNFITGPGGTVGEELVTSPDVDGFIFTGSRAVGLSLMRRFSEKTLKPFIAELGGKNATLIMPSADLEEATEGVLRSAFGMGGEKCSACSRVYVHKQISKPFLELLATKTRGLKIGDPLLPETFLGPLINEAAVKTYQQAVKTGRKDGRLLCGGRVLTEGEFAHGHFVEPALFDQVAKNSRLFQEELFVPVLAVAAVNSLDEAIALANASAYGLTAGIFTQHDNEKEEFFTRIEAGVTYCNRRGGATTGAWPGVQSFGGWKNSGSSGKNALGPYYVAQFMREQSQTSIQR